MFSTNPGKSTLHNNNCPTPYLLSQKKKKKKNSRQARYAGTAGEIRMNS